MLESLKSSIAQSAPMRWYDGREPKEKPIIAGLVLLVGLSLIWLLVWKPLSDWRDLSENRYTNARSVWDWVQANESQARQAAQGAARGSGQPRSLLPVITRAANTHGLKLNRLQPEADGGVSVVLQAQSFNAMLKWLDELDRQHKVNVQRVSLDAEGKPGLINAQLRLQ
jgi:general secretion pathway protein M